ncbi:MAG: acyl-CoA thioesterase [Clostridia bacterium]|nr:acyl-CoA thioesterase [Clostridia bacterium]
MEKGKLYAHKVQYYETDMMGMVHHSNYIRWMEEARIDFMDRLGFSYRKMEEEGVVSPVRSVSCEYKRPCAFGDTISISVTVEGFNGVILTIGYEMLGEQDEIVCKARSEHVFLKKEGGFVRMKRELPEFCAAIEAAMASVKENES